MSPRGRIAIRTTIRARLVEQVTGMVRWRECVGWHGRHGVDRFVEIGAGKVLSGLPSALPTAPSRVGRHARRDRRSRLGLYRSQRQDCWMFDLTSKVALVTGASGGIGGAIARRSSHAGRDGRALRHAAERLDALAAELGERAAAFSATSATARPSRARAGGRGRARRRSTSSSTMPASPATISSSACPTRTGTTSSRSTSPPPSA